MAGLYFDALNLPHVLAVIAPGDQTLSWSKDNAMVGSTLSQIVEDSNLWDLRNGCGNAASMWENLRRSHWDTSSGGRMYWLRKLLLQRLTGTDVEAHINDMQSIHDHLPSLIMPENPLTADDILATALLISLPSDWLLCVCSLLQESRTSSTQIITTLKAEVLRRKAASLHETVDLTTASAKVTSKPSKKPSSNNSKTSKCAFCDRTNHRTDNCWYLQDLKKDHLDLVTKHLKSSFAGSRSGSKSKDVAKIAVVEDSESEDEHSSSAVVESVSSTVVRDNRWTIDSGTTSSMTPIASMLLPKSLQPLSLVVRLADGSRIKAVHPGFLPLVNSARGHPSLHVPLLQAPLLSISVVCNDEMAVLFTKA